MGLRHTAILQWCRLAGVTWALAGCSLQPPKMYPAPESLTIAASFGRTWDAVVEHFATSSVPIRTIERSSGIIVTDQMGVARDDASGWSDCGTDGLGGTSRANRASYNLLVRGDSSTSTIRVTATFTSTIGVSPYGCTSTGAYERELMQFVKARAEKR